MLERIVEPERVDPCSACPGWTTTARCQVNRGYRVQFNSAIGPYKGGLRLHPSREPRHHQVPGLRADLQEQPHHACPWAAARAARDFDPKGKSDMEVMRFCQTFMTELYAPHRRRHRRARRRHRRGRPRDRLHVRPVQAHPERVRGRAHRQGPDLRRLAGPHRGHRLRPAATSPRRCLQAATATPSRARRCVISGSGNVAIYATQKAQQLGAKVVTMSDSTGWVYDPDGHRLSTLLKQIKEVERGRITEYAKRVATASSTTRAAGVWSRPVRHRAALRHPERGAHARTPRHLVANGCNDSSPRAPTCPPRSRPPSTCRSTASLFCPGQGGQRRRRGHLRSGDVPELRCASPGPSRKWTRSCKGIMVSIFHSHRRRRQATTATRATTSMGANIAGFEKVADAMMAQGIV